MGGRFGQPSGICWGLDGDGPRFRPPEGSFVNFLAQMTNTVLRSRRAKRCATAQPAPAARIALSTRQERRMRLRGQQSASIKFHPIRLVQSRAIPEPQSLWDPRSRKPCQVPLEKAAGRVVKTSPRGCRACASLRKLRHTVPAELWKPIDRTHRLRLLGNALRDALTVRPP